MFAEKRRRLPGDLVGPLPGGVLGRFDALSTLAAENADEPTNRVLLPSGSSHNLGQRGTFSALHHRDDLGLLIAAIGSCTSGRLAGGLLGGLDLLGRLPGCARSIRLLRCGFTRLSIPGQRLDRGPDPRYGLLAILELLHGRLAGNAVPDLDEAAHGPVR